MYHGEKFNSISHLFGVMLAIVGCSALVTMSLPKGDMYRIVAFSIYGIATIGLYLTSSIYHSVRGPFKVFMQRMDHISIYLMIAGSYTPFTLITLKGVWGWSLFGVIWGLALIGIIQEVILGKRTRKYSLIIYLLMGWLIVVAMKPMIHALPAAALWWLAAGGLSYTGGVGFYVLDEKIKHFHGVWHLFVLSGTICQFICLYFYV
jgi:hemolysin III